MPTRVTLTARAVCKRMTALSFASLVAAGVDAAPTVAIVRISTQSVRLVNVVRVAVRIARVSEYPRHLGCGKRIGLLDRHEGNVSALSLASGDGPGQPDANRNPQTVYSSHRAPPARLAQQRMAPRSSLCSDISWVAPLRPDRTRRPTRLAFTTA